MLATTELNPTNHSHPAGRATTWMRFGGAAIAGKADKGLQYLSLKRRYLKPSNAEQGWPATGCYFLIFTRRFSSLKSLLIESLKAWAEECSEADSSAQYFLKTLTLPPAPLPADSCPAQCGMLYSAGSSR
jgi:hypothetical protein